MSSFTRQNQARYGLEARFKNSWANPISIWNLFLSVSGMPLRMRLLSRRSDHEKERLSHLSVVQVGNLLQYPFHLASRQVSFLQIHQGYPYRRTLRTVGYH